MWGIVGHVRLLTLRGCLTMQIAIDEKRSPKRGVTRFFGGLVWDKEFPASGTTTPPVHRVWRGQYGIEFSIGSISTKLTGSGSSSSKTETSSSAASKKTSTSK